ncbi:hypothetical protein Phi40:1_gp054 [Cellulophaga phage phi40:1]|uniref:Uncharacterized protein n=1 Tax=Cellulophaga phage phi38:1 TaxID=1327977 RepID=R9ZXV6_9CAUD|nr:hypothetical protein Phi38:1_gp054 [Cellulophaga phage phi38:1]AGO47919.1 hypothetical protein Phi40:1_gp054 [Cellulophaga phage phi40:1]AGO48084.1 hypothetical protein Phi38:1_gp054 [Cellulophaga phage phi38:1]
MKRISYEKLMSLNPTLLSEVINREGQTISLYEHPLYGGDHTIIAAYHPEKIAVNTNFWDTDDLEGEDYCLVYAFGELHEAWEIV